MTHFGDLIIRRFRDLGHPLCVGLDPYVEFIPQVFRQGEMSLGAPSTVAAVKDFLTAVLDVITGRVAIVKPQAALFEQFGWRGMELLAQIVDAAHERGLLVLLDAKRGDIGETGAGYARAYLAADSPIPVDALTVNPYMGPDTIEPFVKAAEATGRGVVVLVRNTNLGAATLQKLHVMDGRPLFQVVADSMQGYERRLRSPETGWSSFAVTAAATSPTDSETIRASLPNTLFLTLGYGAQGGSAADAVRGFVPGPAGLEGGIVNCSRSVLYSASADVTTLSAWKHSLATSVDRASAELQKVVAAMMSR